MESLVVVFGGIYDYLSPLSRAPLRSDPLPLQTLYNERAAAWHRVVALYSRARHRDEEEDTKQTKTTAQQCDGGAEHFIHNVIIMPLVHISYWATEKGIF